MKLIRNNNTTKEMLANDASIFSTANGYIGIRGNFAEGYENYSDSKGTIINGFYENRDYKYEENLPGFPQVGQTITNVISGISIEFIINGQPLNLETSEVISLERTYDITNGLTTREIHYKTKENYEFIIVDKRIASLDLVELFLINISIKSVNYNGEILIKSSLNNPGTSNSISNDPRVVKVKDTIKVTYLEANENIGLIKAETIESNLFMEASFSHSEDFDFVKNEDSVTASKKINIKSNDSYGFSKYVVYTSSNKHVDIHKENQMIINDVVNNDFLYYLDLQKEYLHNFWELSHIEIDGNDYLESVINYNIYQLNCSGGFDSRFNIPAKGLSGIGYEGHHFWDTEIYMIPFFTLTNPLKAKNLLMNRFINLDKSRLEAKILGHTRGAKIPWRTINGIEVSPYYPAGTAQYHINSDVAFAFINYYKVTKDLEFMIKYGFEVIVETARVLHEIGTYYDSKFHIYNVTGPDEYTTCINDNYYTNSMAKFHFEFIVDFYKDNIDMLNEVCLKLQISKSEILDYSKAASLMTLIFDEKLNIFAQDDSFLSKKIWDLKNTPSENHPLLLNYHPLEIYRSQVLKQADVLLSMFLLDFEDDKVLEDSFQYYNKITSHDSSLSKCVYSILANKVNKLDLAYEYLLDISEIDMNNSHKNTRDGLHVANMGGSYMAIVYGLGGIRVHKDYLKINPTLPEGLKGYKFKIKYFGVVVEVSVKDKIYLHSDKRVKIKVYDKQIDLIGDITIDLKSQ